VKKFLMTCSPRTYVGFNFNNGRAWLFIDTCNGFFARKRHLDTRRSNLEDF
jgi:hypothetical protein